MGLIGVGAFALGVITLCAWRRLTGRDPLDVFASMGPRRRYGRQQQQRERGGREQQTDGDEDEDDLAVRKPELFDVWTEGRTIDILKWEESMVSNF
jgi:hypothetical protein